jgi:site-specific recombinase XerD
MTELRRRMLADMQLHGLATGTQEAYAAAVFNLTKYYKRSPDRLTEDEIRDFFLHLINERRIAEGTLKTYHYGIKFFYETTLGRAWPVFDLVRPRKRKKLPVVLSVQEMRHVLGLVKDRRSRMCLTMIYSCGLRLKEGIHLQVRDIDSDRMMIHVRHGKGGKDRYVPLPQRSLELLRSHWKRERPDTWLFPDDRDRHRPVHRSRPYQILKAVVRSSRITKPVSTHTLRHSYATHLLEMGVNLRVIQEILGHGSPKTTAIYTHLTPKVLDGFRNTLDGLMGSL